MLLLPLALIGAFGLGAISNPQQQYIKYLEAVYYFNLYTALKNDEHMQEESKL